MVNFCKGWKERERCSYFSPPTIQESKQGTPPIPALSEDRFFTDWSSIGMESPLVRTLPQSVLVRERG